MRVQHVMLALLVAVAPAKEVSSPARAVTLAHADCAKLHADDQPYVRYLWVSSDEKVREEFLVALGFHLNLLSTQGKLKLPTLISPDVVRIDVREYGWDARLNVWEKFAGLDFFFHQKLKVLKDVEFPTVWPGGPDATGKEYKRGKYQQERKAGRTQDVAALWLPAKEIDALRYMTYSEAPVLCAEWFFVQTARQISIRNKDEGVGYYEWLGLKDRKAYFDLIGLDEKKAGELSREWRAVVDRSGISQQNRMVVALGAVSGRAWVTLDTFTQAGRGNFKRNLRKGEAAHDVEEHYGVLGNGLFVTFLSDKNGVRASVAPPDIGPDDSSLRVGRDSRVHANLSCIRCHGVNKDFLQPVNDWARRTFRQGGVLRLTDKDKKVTLELESQYLRDMDKLLARDRTEYMDAVREVTTSLKNPKGMTAPQITKAYGNAWNSYVESPVTVMDAAREVGTTKEKLLAAIATHAKNRGGGDLILSSFLDGQSITRLEWEDSYRLAVFLAAGLHPLELVEEKKGQ